MNFLLLLILGFFLSGCAAPVMYQVQVTGYGEPGVAAPLTPPRAFFVIDNREAQDPLLEKAIKEKIEKLLGIKGHIVSAFDQADYYLVFSYGQGPGRAVSIPMPVYNPWQYPYYGAYWQPYGFGRFPDYYQPPVLTLYDRWLLVNVIEGSHYREKGEFKRVWLGEARSTGTSGDLRTTLNYLLVALFEDLGKSTGRGRVVEIEQWDFRAQELGR